MLLILVFPLLILHSTTVSAGPRFRVQPLQGRRLGLSKTAQQAVVDKHNLIRGTVKVPCTAADMETLEWSEELALSAQNYADRCLGDQDPNKGSVGENIAYQTFQESTFGLGFTTEDLVRYVEEWNSEGANVEFTETSQGTVTSQGVKSKTYEIPQSKTYGCALYDPDTGACSIRHYIQLTWARTNLVGCGATACQSGLTLRGFTYASGIVFVCRYTPMGNNMSLVPGVGILRPWKCGSCCEGCSTANSCTGLCPVGVRPANPLDQSCNPTTTTTTTTTTSTITTTTTSTTTSTTSTLTTQTKTTATTLTTTTSTTSTTTTTTYCQCVTTVTTSTTSTQIRPCVAIATPGYEVCPELLGYDTDDPDRRLLSMEDLGTPIVNKHNALRAAVSVPCTATDMETLVWDDNLALQAQYYANKCIPRGDTDRGPVGENLVAVRLTGSLETADFVQLVQDWYDESEDVLWSDASAGPVSKTYSEPKASCKLYDASTGACFIGHYTQIIWAKSNKIGCGVAFCSEDGSNPTTTTTASTEVIQELDLNETLDNETQETRRLLERSTEQEATWMVLVCRYSPRGNLAIQDGLTQAVIQTGNMLPPFNFGLKCASCASSCSVHGLCNPSSSPVRCADSLSATTPLIMQPNSYTNCPDLKAAWPGWCNLYEHGYQRCPLSCGHCSIPSGVGSQFCHTTTTTTTSTTTTLTTTPPTTSSTSVTTTTRECVWVCYSDYSDFLGSLPVTNPPIVQAIITSTLGTTTTTTLERFSENADIIIVASLVLTVPDGATFSNDTNATNAVVAGIADALGVPKDYLALRISAFGSGRNRRLASKTVVTVEYTVTIPASASGTFKSAVVHRARTVTLVEMSKAIQKAVTAAKGSSYSVSLNSMTEPTISSVAQLSSPGTTSSSISQARCHWWTTLVGFVLSRVLFSGCCA